MIPIQKMQAWEAKVLERFRRTQQPVEPLTDKEIKGLTEEIFLEE